MKQELFKEILNHILKRYKGVIAVLIHGSAVNGKLVNYSDIDLNIFISGKVKEAIENKIIEWNGKKIFVNLNIGNYKSDLNSVKNEQKLDMILINLASYRKIKVLYDKRKSIPKFVRAVNQRVKEIREKQIKRLPTNFNIMIDFFFKLKRSYNRKNDFGIFQSVKAIANQSVKIIQFFNKLDIDNLYIPHYLPNYNAILKLKKIPSHFKEDFKICTGLTTKKLTIKEIYTSGVRMAKETINFLDKQDLKEIKNKEFFELLEQSKNLIKRG